MRRCPKRIAFVLEQFAAMGMTAEEEVAERSRLWTNDAYYVEWCVKVHEWCVPPPAVTIVVSGAGATAAGRWSRGARSSAG